MNDCGISKLDLKRRNRMQILKVVREQGPSPVWTFRQFWGSPVRQ